MEPDSQSKEKPAPRLRGAGDNRFVERRAGFDAYFESDKSRAFEPLITVAPMASAHFAVVLL
jgi:hypothetical protein